MKDYRYKGGIHCEDCGAWEEHDIWFACPHCGDEDPNNFAILRFRWEANPRASRWWNPLSWVRGWWVFDGVGKAKEEA
jgi:hypothetical protein